MEEDKTAIRPMSRRSFLRGATLVAAGATLAGCAPAAAPPAPTAAPQAPAAAPKPAATTAAKQEPLKLRTYQPQSSREHNTVRAAIRFSDAVKQRTNGLVEFQIYGPELGTVDEAIQGMKMGTIDAGLYGDANMANFEPAIGLLGLPFLYKSSQALYKILAGDIGAELQARLLKNVGMRVICFMDMGYRDFFSKKEFKTADDFKGVKVRAMTTPAHVRLMQLIGMNPVPLAWPETYNAVKAGVVDAFDTTLVVGFTQKFYEVSKYVTLTHHQSALDIVGVREAMWQRMTPETQKIVMEEAQNAQTWQLQTQAEEEAASISNLQKMGLVVNKFDITPMIPMVKPMHDEFSSKPGHEGLIDRVLKAQG